MAKRRAAPTDGKKDLFLSLCMIVKNEAKSLPRCLESVRGVVDEIVVVDTGSTDDTVAVAERYGARVFHFRWCDDFSAARNDAVAHARGRWILALDADEALARDARRTLRGLLTDDRFQAYLLNIRSPLKGTRSQGAVINAWPRVFRNRPEIRYEGRVHEQISPSIARMAGTISATNLVIDHLGYHQDFSDQIGKQTRNLALLERDLAEHPDDPMTMFHYGEALGLGGKIPEAVAAYRSALANPKMPKQNAAVAWRGLANGLLRLKEYAGAIDACRRAAETDGGYSPPHLLAAMALGRLGRHVEAIEELDIYVRLGEQTKLVGARVLEHEVDLGFALALKGDCLLSLGLREEAEAAFREAIRRQPEAPEGFLGMGRIHSLRGGHGEAVRAFEKAKALFKELPRGHLALAESHAAQQHWVPALDALEPFLEAEPGDPRGLALRAEGLLHAGRHAEAQDAFKHLLEVDPSADAHLALACLAESRSAHDEVLAHCREAIALGGDDARIYFLEGKSRMARGESGAAEASLLEALRRAPKTCEIYESLAALALSAGDAPKALDYFQNLLALAPHHALAARAIPVLRASLATA
jgi:tetratricopeptide (TPR) repeat protein